MSELPQNIVPGLVESFAEMKEIRQDIHRHPELGCEEYRTSGIVADCLQRWGYRVRQGVGGTGVVGTLKVGNGERSIGLRADMDALPIHESSGKAYSSVHEGVMHACGHDGHTAILLAAAKHLAQTKSFSGTLNVIFQPAEEGLGGGLAMVEDGLFEQAPCDAIYALHNYPTPTLKFGQMAISAGAIMASVDSLIVTIQGKGGHAASPHFACDPIIVAAAIIQAVQTIVSRNIRPDGCAVVSITSIQAGSAFNVIPDALEMKLSVRTYDEAEREFILNRINEIVQAQATSFGAKAKVKGAMTHYPVLINAEAPTQKARDVAEKYFGTDSVVLDHPAILAADDFAFMTQKVPGCYINIGAGEGAALHNKHYDFNDDLILVGGSFWVYLVQTLLPQE